MRADRLLSLLMLLQSRGRMTAGALARELEGSERTIYRDIDALGSAGVPVYGDSGPDGGYALLDSYRTSLTGLKEGEARALFMLNLSLLRVPAPWQDLGVSQELKTALLKLSAALPTAQRGGQEQVRQRFYLDLSGWPGSEVPAPTHLKTIHQAVWSDCRLWLAYRSLPGVLLERLVDPYGLVARAGAWYLVCAREGHLRVHRVADLLESEVPRGNSSAYLGSTGSLLGELVRRAARSPSRIPVQVRVAPGFVPSLPYHFGSEIRDRIAQAGPPDREGWIELGLSFETLEAARDRLLDFGCGVEVLAPLALRLSLLDHAEQLVKLYYRGGTDG
jgi:predicted DNA-binding transcriptional regulator YafY